MNCLRILVASYNSRLRRSFQKNQNRHRNGRPWGHRQNMASRVTRLVQPAIAASAASAGGRRRIRAISMDVTGTMVQFNGKIEVSSCSGWNRLGCVYAVCYCSQITNNLQIFRFLLSHRTIMARPQNGAALICPPPKWSPFPPHSIRRTRKQARNFHVLATLPCRPKVVEGVRHPMPGAERCQDDSRSGGEGLSASLQHLWIACDVQCLSGRPAIPQLGTSTGNHLRRCIECR